MTALELTRMAHITLIVLFCVFLRTFYGKIECIDNFISTCFTTEKKEMYDRMRQGSMGVIDDLCNDGKFRNDYLQHASCFSNSSNFHQCMDSFKQLLKESVYWTGNDNQGVDKSLVSYCCATSKYEACTYEMVLQHCGHETVAFYQLFINRSSSAFKGRCVNYTADSEWCSEANILNVQSYILLQLLLIVTVVNFGLIGADNSIELEIGDIYHCSGIRNISFFLCSDWEEPV